MSIMSSSEHEETRPGREAANDAAERNSHSSAGSVAPDASNSAANDSAERNARAANDAAGRVEDSAAERNAQAAKSTRLPDGRPPRRSGDGWMYGSDGKKHWGLGGAAGLMLVDPERGVLMQHRALWSVEGGTWGFPGGARDMGESAVDAAIRESWEEAGRSEEHTSELQSRGHLVCRLLLEKNK